MVTTKKHGWLVGALADNGYQQRDLAQAWKVDDAVVSRFISSGKPDLTPQRQMLLAQMLRMTNDQLLSRLYGEMRAIPPRPQQHEHAAADDLAAALVNARRAVQRVQELLPDAKVHFSVVLNNGGVIQ